MFEVDFRVRDEESWQRIAKEEVGCVGSLKKVETEHKKKSECIQDLESWRQKLAAFEDEGVEYVLQSGLIKYMVKRMKEVSHSQDLMNLASQFYEKKYKFIYVPFFFKIYCKDITDILLQHKARKIQKASCPEKLYAQLLSNPEITHDFLDKAFAIDDPSAEIDKELRHNEICGSQTLLKIVNMLNNGEQDTN